MHADQMNFVAGAKQRFPFSFCDVSVLEVGSYNVNGTVRALFDSPRKYVGLDVAPGKDVDMVCHGADYLSAEKFDTVISTECFEHDPRWVETFTNMLVLTRPGGLVVFTCAANNRYEHGTPRTTPEDSALAIDYYCNLNVRDFEMAFDLRLWFVDYVFEARFDDLYFYGVRGAK